MNKTDTHLIDLLDDWFKNLYQEVYHEGLELNKCKNLHEANGQWKMVSHINENDVNTYIFENIYLKKSAQIIDDYVLGFFPQQDFAFFIHLNENGRTQVEIVDLEYFQKRGHCSDWHIGEVTVTPDFLNEVCEGSFNSEENVENTRKKLLELGFIENLQFSTFMSPRFMPTTTAGKNKKTL